MNGIAGSATQNTSLLAETHSVHIVPQGTTLAAYGSEGCVCISCCLGLSATTPMAKPRQQLICGSYE